VSPRATKMAWYGQGENRDPRRVVVTKVNPQTAPYLARVWGRPSILCATVGPLGVQRGLWLGGFLRVGGRALNPEVFFGSRGYLVRTPVCPPLRATLDQTDPHPACPPTMVPGVLFDGFPARVCGPRPLPFFFPILYPGPLVPEDPIRSRDLPLLQFPSRTAGLPCSGPGGPARGCWVPPSRGFS